jgi:biopolymer transport protein ExbD
MSNIMLSQPKQMKAGGKRMKKATLQVDMTPMVDLGFLLITFFIFTATISEPQETDLFMPAVGEPTKIQDDYVLTTLLAKDNRIFVYPGRWQDAYRDHRVRETSYFVKNGLGNDVREKQKQLDLLFGNGSRKKLMLLIKPGDQATYQNIINALDEVMINNVGKYAIVEPDKEESAYLKDHLEGQTQK